MTKLLQISANEGADTNWIRLEGSVAGPCTKKFERVWRQIAAERQSKKFGADLRGLMHTDRGARRVLAEIDRETGAAF